MSVENLELMRLAASQGIQLSISSPTAFSQMGNRTMGILLDSDCEQSSNLLKTVSCYSLNKQFLEMEECYSRNRVSIFC